MRKALALGLLAVCCLAPALRADSAADVRAISDRGHEFVAAWDKDDAKAMAGIFSPEGDLINPFGRVAKGRAEIEKLFTDEHASFMKGTTFKVTHEVARVVGGEVGILDWDVDVLGLKAADGSPAPPFKNHVTIVLAKRGGTWWAEAARPVVYVPPPGAPK